MDWRKWWWKKIYNWRLKEGRGCIATVPMFTLATLYLAHALSLPSPNMILGSHQMRENFFPMVVKVTLLLMDSTLLSSPFTYIMHNHPSLLHIYSSFIQCSFTLSIHPFLDLALKLTLPTLDLSILFTTNPLFSHPDFGKKFLRKY